MLSATRCTAGKYLLLIPVLIFLLFAVYTGSNAQSIGMDECSGGTYYLLAFPDTTTNTWDSRFPSQLIRTQTKAFNFYIYSPVDQLLEIGRVNGAGTRVPISAGQILEYSTEQTGVPLVTVINTPQTNVIKLESDYPVIVYGYMLTPFGAEAFTPIPVDAWGTEYYAAAWPGEIVRDISPNGEFNYRAVPKQGEGEILIIAAYDNTQVTISPNADLRNCAGCQTVTLMAGEAYLVQSTTDTAADAEVQPDLGGTYIQSTRNIGVISGNPRVMHNKGTKASLGENSFMNMNIEWIPPVEQHGTEFVFMPTWDDRRQREGLDPDESRSAEVVRIFGTSDMRTEAWWRNSSGDSVATVTPSFEAGEFTHETIGTPVARVFKTSQPAMAMSAPYAVVKFNGTTSWGANYVGASYLSWSSFMVEMVPREQWTSFAPVRAPSLPTLMVHYLNVVTDSNNQFNVYYRQGNSPRQLFPFNRGTVPGSGLVWGSMQLNKGVDYFIEGDGGARFSGYAYGSYRGQEQYRPGGTRRDDDDKGPSINGGRSGDPEVLHPSEYEEDVALMYGFPLAPSRCVLRQPDDYDITTTYNCDEMLIEVTTKNSPASGIGSVAFLPDSSTNVRMEFIEPADPFDFNSQKITEAKVRIVPLDPKRNAHAVVVIRDRTREGRGWRVVYNWEAERVNVNPSSLNFGYVTADTAGREQLVTITNPLRKNVVLKRMRFALGTHGFFIARTQPNFSNNGIDSLILRPGQSLKVWINILPARQGMHVDSLSIVLGCGVETLPLKAWSVPPCIFVDDLDFGTMNVGETRVNELEICNKGVGEVTLQDPWLTWLTDIQSQQGFNVDRTEIDKLKGRVLAKDECVSITVSFTAPDQGGTYGTTARIWSDTRQCRDTSIWRARVLTPYCLTVGDLDFGIMQVDQSRTLELEICNRGEGEVIFNDPWLTWRGNDFGVAGTEIDKLKGRTLQASECITVRVAFSAGDTGTFSTVARLWANTRQCRDTSIWSVRVIDPSLGVAGDEVTAGYAIESITPNPFSREARIDFKLGRSGRTVVEIYNIDGERVATLLDEQMSAGEQSIRWNAEEMTAGIYHVRIRSGAWSGTTQVALVR